MTSTPQSQFARIERLPPYVFNITTELKMEARRRGEDIIDFGMGNPDGPTPKHIVDKLIETVVRPDTHGYSVSTGIRRLRPPRCRRSTSSPEGPRRPGGRTLTALRCRKEFPACAARPAAGMRAGTASS